MHAELLCVCLFVLVPSEPIHTHSHPVLLPGNMRTEHTCCLFPGHEASAAAVVSTSNAGDLLPRQCRHHMHHWWRAGHHLAAATPVDQNRHARAAAGGSASHLSCVACPGIRPILQTSRVAPIVNVLWFHLGTERACPTCLPVSH
jgi:hypothetical protein